MKEGATVIRHGGYLSPAYAESLSEFGTPFKLPSCGGWVLKRDIPGWPYKDAMGCYPLFSCKDWSKIGDDIAALKGELVSLTLVTDPFGDFSQRRLSKIFDTCYLFKKHFVTDLSKPLGEFVRKRSLRYATNALKNISIEHCDQPDAYLSDWLRLYGFLKERHHICGIRAFSRKCFERLMKIPGMEMFVAKKDQEVVGASIWLVCNGIGYGHLFAMSPLGYQLNTACALYYHAIKYFSRRLRWLDFGGVAGTKDTEGGLDLFKRGWTTGTKPVYFCGSILDKEKYDAICDKKHIKESSYFPAYRSGEYE